MIEYRVKVYDNKTEWYLNGQLHREDGPAIEHTNGGKQWYIKGQPHRIDGPAIEYTNGGTKFWYLNGVFHREDGPAIEYPDGAKSWYINGVDLTEVEFNNRNKVELTLEDIAEKFNDNGDIRWFLNGKLHRTDGPAVEYSDGTKSWFINGKLHREDGPAIELSNGGKSWYINGKNLTEEEFNNRNKVELTLEELRSENKRLLWTLIKVNNAIDDLGLNDRFGHTEVYVKRAIEKSI